MLFCCLHFVKECRVADILAWRWLMDRSCIAVRFFGSKRASQAAETDAFAARLNTISARTKVEQSAYCDAEDPVTPGQVRQVFWTPEEVAAARHD
jgi:hypothetical protein